MTKEQMKPWLFLKAWVCLSVWMKQISEKKKLHVSSMNTLNNLGWVHIGYVYSQGKSYYDDVLENKQ